MYYKYIARIHSSDYEEDHICFGCYLPDIVQVTHYIHQDRCQLHDPTKHHHEQTHTEYYICNNDALRAAPV